MSKFIIRLNQLSTFIFMTYVSSSRKTIFALNIINFISGYTDALFCPAFLHSSPRSVYFYFQRVCISISFSFLLLFTRFTFFHPKPFHAIIIYILHSLSSFNIIFFPFCISFERSFLSKHLYKFQTASTF